MIKCPNCGESYYRVKYSTTTAAYYPPIFKDGININPDKNSKTTYCECCNCDYTFYYEGNPNRDDFGKTILGPKKPKVEIIEVNTSNTKPED